MTVLVVSSDLLFTSQVSGAAARTGAELLTVSAPSEVAARCLANSPDLLLLDLSLPGLDISSFVTELHSLQPSPRIIAFGPHVQFARLEAARAAGCDQVLSRGAVHAQLDELLKH